MLEALCPIVRITISTITNTIIPPDEKHTSIMWIWNHNK